MLYCLRLISCIETITFCYILLHLPAFSAHFSLLQTHNFLLAFLNFFSLLHPLPIFCWVSRELNSCVPFKISLQLLELWISSHINSTNFSHQCFTGQYFYEPNNASTLINPFVISQKYIASKERVEWFNKITLIESMFCLFHRGISVSDGA